MSNSPFPPEGVCPESLQPCGMQANSNNSANASSSEKWGNIGTMAKIDTQQVFEATVQALFGWCAFDTHENFSVNGEPVYRLDRIEKAWRLFRTAAETAQAQLSDARRQLRLAQKTNQLKADLLTAERFEHEKLKRQRGTSEVSLVATKSGGEKKDVDDSALDRIVARHCVERPSDQLKDGTWSSCLGGFRALQELRSMMEHNNEVDKAKLAEISDTHLVRVIELEHEALSCISTFHDQHTSLVAKCRAMDQLETLVTGQEPTLGRLPLQGT
jgi:hypothetical protein